MKLNPVMLPGMHPSYPSYMPISRLDSVHLPSGERACGPWWPEASFFQRHGKPYGDPDRFAYRINATLKPGVAESEWWAGEVKRMIQDFIAYSEARFAPDRGEGQ